MTARIIIVSLVAFDFVLIALHLLVRGDFDLDGEYNLPTLYQAIKLLCLGFLTYMLYGLLRERQLQQLQLKQQQQKQKSQEKQHNAKHPIYVWGMLAIMFAYIGLDEWFQIHEWVSNQTHLLLLEMDSTVAFAAWLLPYFPLIAIAAVIFVAVINLILQDKEVRQSKIYYFFMAGAFSFVMVPVVEVVSTWGWELDADSYPIFVALEEGFELLGASSFFAYVLLRLKQLNDKQ